MQNHSRTQSMNKMTYSKQIGCISTKLWVLKGKIWCRSWLPFIFWQINLCKPLSTHTHNVGMVYKKKLTSKKLSKQFTMPTGTNGHGNNNWERRDEKKNPRICYPFPIVLCIGKNEEIRIIILLLCTLPLFLSRFPPNILTCCLSHEIFLFSFPHICAYQGTKFNGQMLFIAS